MASLWNKFQAFLASKGGFTHIIVVAFLTGMTLYGAVPAVTNLFNSIYALFPPWGHQLILAIVGVVAFYKTTSSKAGIVAKAQIIMESPNPPTPEQVSAANVATK